MNEIQTFTVNTTPLKNPELLILAMVALQDEIMEHPEPMIGALVWMEESAEYDQIICGSEFKRWDVGIEVIGYCYTSGDWFFPDEIDSEMRALLGGVEPFGNGRWSHPLLTADMDLPEGAWPWSERETLEAEDFPQEICPKGEDGECAFATRGLGLGCTTCGFYVHPSESPKLEQYYKNLKVGEPA